VTGDGSDLKGGSRPLFSRDELLGGLPARRAATLVFAIEARTARLVDRSRRAMATFETDRSSREHEAAFLQALAGARELPVRVTAQDLERYAAAWAPLVPTDPALRAAVIRRLGGKYPLAPGRMPRLAGALGVDEPGVLADFERAYGQPVASVYTPPSPREHVRWLRAAASERLESLPPFWMAFALALTETIAEGILAIPVAVAGVGPLAGIGLLVILGLVNVVTLAALVEAITRTGRMRYGETYFGRLVREYLGSGGAVAFTVALFLFNVVCLLVYLLGFASVLADASGVGLVWWVALLFAINVYFIRRETLDATVASALVIGAVNIGLILLISAIGLLHLDPANLAPPDLGGGLVLEAGLLQLVFGVILVAYFGHTSAGNAAKLILREDMTGRALLGGNVVAMITVIALYALGVLAINGAVGAEPLIGYEGTSISPLADVAGPGVLVLGSLYVILALGIGSIYASLGLTNQVREWLPTSVDGGPGVIRRLLATRAGRSLVALVPVAIAFLVLELLILAEADDFTAPLGIVGILTIPLLGGIFPMLLLAAARRRGEFVPRPVVAIIGHPFVVGAISLLYIAAIALHGLVIWQGPLERVLALTVAVGVSVVAVRAGLAGSFRPRTVVQVRVEGEGPGTAHIEVVADGRPTPAAIDWRSGAGGGGGSVDAAEATIGEASRLERVAVSLAGVTGSEARLWIHRVDAASDSVAWPIAVSVSPPGAEPRPALDAFGVVDRDVSVGPLAIELRPIETTARPTPGP
jgi:amino acid permease